MIRDRLPNRRGSETFEFNHAGIDYLVTFSRYADGRLGEAFITGVKLNTQADIMARDCAISASLALQHGCEVADLRDALTLTETGQPAGPLAVALDLIAVDAAPAAVPRVPRFPA